MRSTIELALTVALLNFSVEQGFPYWGWMGGRFCSFHPLHQKKSLPPPPNFCAPPPTTTTKGSFPPPLNNNFLNGQNHPLSDSHPPIKKSTHCTVGKGFSPYTLKLFGKLCPPSFQSLNQSFISNQRPISM